MKAGGFRAMEYDRSRSAVDERGVDERGVLDEKALDERSAD